jgi:hypothetical protein
MSNTRALETSNQAVLPVSTSGTLASYVSNPQSRPARRRRPHAGMRESIIGRCFTKLRCTVSAASHNVSNV